ncbi:hypothetical protein Ancab_014673, partial [Ancistrocladus abbreviatus]
VTNHVTNKFTRVTLSSSGIVVAASSTSNPRIFSIHYLYSTSETSFNFWKLTDIKASKSEHLGDLRVFGNWSGNHAFVCISKDACGNECLLFLR